MKKVIIVQARMRSKRLPGKILKEVLGKPLLSYQLERLKRVTSVDSVVVATSTNEADDPVANLCSSLGVLCSRGPELDVLARYYQTACEHKADIIARCTADCPLIDPELVSKTIDFFTDNLSRYDYIANGRDRSFPRGMDTEVFTFATLEQAHMESTRADEREHVTLHMYSNPEKFRCGSFHYRWTVDEQEDFDAVRAIIEKLYPDNPTFTISDIFTLLAKHPELASINLNIQQK
ncbi:glycosyltransferase family protein [Simkania negevensis]|uniref:Glycosyltransferase family protein n=1 Tax=Simkania negevensis TaxID=83561 RepID=A0ABS3ASU8_9BACT|nr:glycosyltransferase family protein [Simkania negevensis]